MNIVICDDISLFISQLKAMIVPIFDKNNIKPSVYSFSTGNDLISWYDAQNQPIDFLFIDVEMPGINGVETLRKLRCKGSKCQAVFISSHRQYVFEAMDYDIENYLIKPLEQDKVTRLLKRLIEQYKHEHAVIELKTRSKHEVVSVNDIIMVESQLRKLIYHTKRGEITIHGKISDAEKALRPYHFLKSHKSYLINMDHVLCHEHYTFTLTDNYTAEISHTKRAAIIAEFEQYYREKQL